MDLLIPIKRALISVSDKTGVIELAQSLADAGCEIISTGGTQRKLEEAGITTTEISKVTGNPEAFGGRMKTISFNIESALLFDREKDAEEAAALNIESIDLVVCNLYPFQKVLEQGANFETLIENIDIGGPTMIRAAAKNFKYVATVTQPSDYNELMAQLKSNKGALTYDFRKKLMCKAFNHTADYDALIATTMDQEIGIHSLRLGFEEGTDLRYGENSHQSARFYKQKGAANSLYDLNVLHGKALSFNNILDINGAIEAIKEATRPACSVIKHSNPCGLCEGDHQAELLQLAWAGDPISAFGSIIAFNQTVTLETVQFFQLDNEDRSKRKFVEVVIAPDFTPEALAYLQQHKNLRIIEFNAARLVDGVDYRYMNGSLLVQDTDTVLHNKLDVVTEKTVDMAVEQPLIEFGLRAIKTIKSNSIAIVRFKNGYAQLLGMGAGQPNRLVATKLSIEKCRENLRNEYTGAAEDFEAYVAQELANAWLISDAFFPFADNVELAAAAGVRKIVQPGGSIRDKSVVNTCNELGVSMVFTGIRHFKH
ncbi:bifunctional phosphoribosylaminoimidazolecarboxamide formyltransferase/IMP cyclohydrolase [Aureispira anguillae]|uniref:Bifunctional purine biosynthesis protein PurH n=1 Tax=Aureispira anguillae TaxID=2864201 RepID=A0A916DWN7_9BACT|nr:bifunctional phosphoribosylaminoimidazolecarboxamide formyltransferase/IMP cyclohydrolase [Aureispira anguillae]BDS14890.1 bifunctional phosphoribosylaminoimidazolecarboxamide formyltransferase/IMP cyclohydrolase [Aureispira anguillae]